MKDHQQKVSPAVGKVSSDMTNIHKEITIDNRIFLKGFKLDTKEEDLENVFKKYGMIVETKIIRDAFNGQSRGFGFITFDSQQVAQEVLSSVQSIQIDDTEITVGPAKMRRVPPHKAFRTNNYNRFPSAAAQNSYVPPPPSTPATQYFSVPSVPCFVSPDGFFTWLPNTPYPKMPYHDQSTPIVSDNSNGAILETLHGNPATPALEHLEHLPSKENHQSKGSSELTGFPTVKYENGVNVPLKSNASLQQQHFNSEVNGKSNNEFKPSLFPTASNYSGDSFHPSIGNQFHNNVYLPSSNPMSNAAGGVIHNLPTFMNIANNESTAKHPNNTFMPIAPHQFIPNGMDYKQQYDNHQSHHHQQQMIQNNGNVDLTIISSGIATMMPPNYHYVPVTTAHQFMPGVEFKTESNTTTDSSSYALPPSLKHNSNNAASFPKESASIKDCPAPPLPSPSKPNGSIAAMKAQNFVFMSTGPGKVNRVVVH